MYLDSSHAARSASTSRRRGACRKPVRPDLDSLAARRTRLDDAIVAQWLLDQLPSDHRHAFARPPARSA